MLIIILLIGVHPPSFDLPLVGIGIVLVEPIVDLLDYYFFCLLGQISLALNFHIVEAPVLGHFLLTRLDAMHAKLVHLDAPWSRYDF